MWRRAYLLLVLVRLYFALQPSYIHPDEHFQGPEVVAGASPPRRPLRSAAPTDASRPSLRLEHDAHLGVHRGGTHPQRVPAMAALRAAHAAARLDGAR